MRKEFVQKVQFLALKKNPRMFDGRFRDSGLNIFNPVAYEFTASTLIVVPWRFILMVPNEAEVGVALDFAEDLSDDVLSKVVLHSRARDALCLAACSRSLLWAVDTMAHRLFAETFGTSDLPTKLAARSIGSVGCRGKILIRLDRARSKHLDDLRETFSWAAGHGYCSFLTYLTQSWESSTFLVHLLNGKKGPENIPPPLWRAAKRHQAKAVILLLELRADPEALAFHSCVKLFDKFCRFCCPLVSTCFIEVE